MNIQAKAPGYRTRAKLDASALRDELPPGTDQASIHRVLEYLERQGPPAGMVAVCADPETECSSAPVRPEAEDAGVRKNRTALITELAAKDLASQGTRFTALVRRARNCARYQSRVGRRFSGVGEAKVARDAKSPGKSKTRPATAAGNGGGGKRQRPGIARFSLNNEVARESRPIR